MAEIIKPPFPLFPDSSGEEINNGYVYIGTAGVDPEASPITVYWDSALTIAAVQPLRTVNGQIVNGGSAAKIWTGASDYSIKVKNASRVVQYASLSGNTSTLDAASITYNQGGLGAVDRTQRSKNQEVVSVLDFGADPTGATDSTSAINSAIIEAGTAAVTAWYRPGKVLLPAGTYKATTIPINDLNVELVGDGAVVQTSGTVGVDIGSADDLDVLTGGLFTVGLKNLRFEAAAGTIAIRNRGCRTIQFDGLYVSGGSVGIDTQGAFACSYFRDVTCQSQTSIGFDIKIHNNLLILDKCRALSSIPIGVRLGAYSGTPPSFELEGVYMGSCDISGCVDGLYIEGLIKNLTVDTLYTESNTGKDILIDNSAGSWNKLGIRFINCKPDSSVGLGSSFGTDATGSLIRNLRVEDCEFADSTSAPAWNTATAYSVGDRVTEAGVRYRCQEAHTSGVFATDLAAGRWASTSVSFIGGDKILDSYVNSFFTGVIRTIGDQSSLINDQSSTHLGESMPQFVVNPALAFGTSDFKGKQGEIRYEDGWLYMKTAGGHQRSQLADFDDSNGILAPLPTGGTPSVAGLKTCRTTNTGAMSITEFAGAKAGQELIIVGADGGNTTIADGTYISLAGSSNFALSNDSTIHLVCRAVSGGRAYFSEIGRSSN